MGKILDVDRVHDGIHAAISAFTESGLTVAEAIETVRSLDAALKGMYPEAYEAVSTMPMVNAHPLEIEVEPIASDSVV